MDGILIIDKPAGITSHDVVARVRRVLKTKRVGHTGTLDPFATGVMVILVGRATRLAQFLDKDEKEYEAVIQFGFETDTGDMTGARSAECGMRDEDRHSLLVSQNWNEVFAQFLGEIEQTPPMYSAKKVDGKKLYELARQGIEIERKSVTVTIPAIDLLDSVSASPTIRMRVVCSAGTYIRTLAQDIGRKIGVGAHLTELRRTRAGKFGISKSISLDRFQELEGPASAILPITDAVEHLPSFELTADRAAKTKGGLSTRASDQKFLAGEPIRMQDEAGELIAIGFYDEAENSIRPKIVLV
ncbi:MAG: tRNA pseudouridine(55) synthase TruB [Acidobacteriota bacterium]